MTVKEFMDRIELPEDARKAAAGTPLPEHEFARMSSLFWQDRDAFWEETEKRPDTPLWFLRFFSAMGPECFLRFREAGIPEDVFSATLKDITIWARAFFRRHGYYGLSEARWVARGMHMEVLRLGRLQFEPSALPDKTPVLKVHIPEDGPLKQEEALDSFRRAKDFFSRPFAFFTCDSWLLFPGLSPLLPRDSNILQFQQMFEILGTDLSSRQAEERIFGFLADSPEDYPAVTSLQKRAKKYYFFRKNTGQMKSYMLL